MTAALALMTGALLIAMVAPVALSRIADRGGDPAAALTGWAAVLTAVVVSAGSGAALLLVGDRPHPHEEHLHACWAVFGHIRWHPLDELAGAAIAALLGVAAVRACLFVRRGLRAQRRVHQAHLLVWLSFTRPQNDGVLWLEHDKPFAYSVPGRPSLIVASTALNLLPAGYRDAVLHHERHHLRRRHHLLVIGARAIRHALVPLPLFIRLPAQVESLTELAADKHASQQCGLDAVRGALAAIGPATAAGSRLRHLAEPVPAQRLKRREFFHRATATLPALSATALSLLAALTC